MIAFVYLLLVVHGLRPNGYGHDFIPAYAAAQLLERGAADAIYLDGDARHLFDVDPRFDAVYDELSRDDGPQLRMTAFVAPPLSLLPTLPLARLPFPVALFMVRLSLVALAIFALHVHFRVRRPDDSRVELANAVGLLFFSPVLWYCIGIGQISMIFLAAATCFGAPWRLEQRALPALLAAAIAFKIIPGVLLGFLILMRRWNAALWTLGILIAWWLVSLLFLPFSLHADFLEGARALGSHVITDWNNVSADALLTRFEIGTDGSPVFVTPPGWILAVITAFKLTVFALCAWIAAGCSHARDAERWSAAWVGTLVLSPLLWAHYLVVLPVVLPSAHGRWLRARLVLLGWSGLYLFIQVLDVLPNSVVGLIGGLLWLSVVATVVARGFNAPAAAAVHDQQ